MRSYERKYVETVSSNVQSIHSNKVKGLGVSSTLGINTLISMSFVRCSDTHTAAFPAVQMRGLPHDCNNPPATMGHLPGVTKTHPGRYARHTTLNNHSFEVLS